MHEELFGNYLLSVQERDIDLLLMEEFHISNQFVSWFCNKVGLKGVLRIGAWHSVHNSDGETDLLLVVQAKKRRIGILIENKVGANEQDEQDVRYHKRGRTAVKDGKIDKYLTVICAPSGYLRDLPKASQYQYQVAYEDIADWFRQFDDLRADWRCQIISQAIEQRRRGSVMIKNPQITVFHADFWRYLRANHPSLLMNKPSDKGSKSNWIIVKRDDFPKKVKIHFKFDQQVVELGFENCSIEEIVNAVPKLTDGIIADQKGGTAVLSIATDPINVRNPMREQTKAIEAAIASVFKLTPYAKLLKG
jgi:PD-(D/E)XK nuclease superfamily